MRTLFIAAGLTTLVAAPGLAKAPTPRITEPAARATALARVKGGVVKANELETEHGRLIYSYDITRPGMTGIDEVNIDAMTGKLVAMHHESPAAERVEAAADAKAARVKHK